MNKSLLRNKLSHYNLNLDYPISTISIEDQTNCLINKTINNFIMNYEKDFGKKIFVYEFNDDLLSLVGYKILLAIQAIKENFTFKIFGKFKKTKDYKVKKQKFCSKKELLKLKDKIVFISSLSSIYEVANILKSSTIFQTRHNLKIKPNFYILKQFTYQEILTAQKFYKIGYIKDGFYLKDNPKLLEKFNWINNLNNTPNINLRIQSRRPPLISLIWIGDNLEDNIKLLQEIEKSNNLAFYYYSGKQIPQILSDNLFKILLKRTTNRPEESYMNINEYELPMQLSKIYDIPIELKGKWPQFNLTLLECQEMEEEDNNENYSS